MAALKGNSRALSWILGALGCVAGFLAYDATASSQMLQRSDCRELAPIVTYQFEEANRFIESEPENWYDLQKFYRALRKDLDRYQGRTEELRRAVEILREDLDRLDRSVYRFTPSRGNRERLQEAEAKLARDLQALQEMCR